MPKIVHGLLEEEVHAEITQIDFFPDYFIPQYFNL